MIKTYKTKKFGVFSVIADDDIYSSLTIQSNINFYRNGQITPLGQTLKNILKPDRLPIQLSYNTGGNIPIDETVRAGLQAMFPLLTDNAVNGVTTSYQYSNEKILGSDTNSLRVRYVNLSSANPAGLNLSTNFVLNGDIQTVYHAFFPLGCWTNYESTSTKLTNYSLYLGVFNSDFSACRMVSFFSNPSAPHRFSVEEITGSELNIYKTFFVGTESSPTDPYAWGGNAGGGGGTGDFDDTSDTIGLPSLPTLSGLNTGFFTAFIPSASQMQSVSNYLWNNFLEDIIDPDLTIGEKVDALKKIVANPYDAIMGCSVIPVTPPTAGSKELKMYGLIDTGISIPYASTRWVTVDCGTLNIHEFWGGYLDYSPYTKTTSLYLPYIGTVSIDIDLIMAKALQVVYRVDILSGICVAFILVDGSVKFHYQGQCATQIPITNADYSSAISAGIGLIGSASQVVGSAVAGASTGGPVGAVVGAVGSAVSQAPAVASNVMGAKPDIRSGGSVGSSAGILSVQRPYLIIERPRQSLPERQNTFTGYPSNVTASVGELTGYTEFETINLDNLFLTDAEKEELTNILKGGVYL